MHVTYEDIKKVGSCNGCCDRHFKVYVISLRSIEVRMCAKCMEEFKQQLRKL